MGKREKSDKKDGKDKKKNILLLCVLMEEIPIENDVRFFNFIY